jgi:hypothetical protein
MERKNDKHTKLKRMIKNEHDFLRILVSDPDFLRALYDLAHMPDFEWIRDELPFPATQINMADRFDQYARFMDWGMKIKKTRSIGGQIKIDDTLDHWMTKKNLGQEWKDTLITLVTMGHLFPPMNNFHMEKNGKRIQIILNPDTSIGDLRLAWNDISQAVDTAWPDFKKTNLAKGTKKNLEEALDTLKAKSDISSDFKYQHLSPYERARIGSETDLGRIRRMVSNYRSKLKLVHGVPQKPLKIKTKKSDRDIVRELHGLMKKKEENKKVNLLKQHRRRLKR